MPRLTPDDILAQYPGPVTLRAPKGQVLATCVALILLCAYLAFQDSAQSKAAGIVFGGVFLLLAVINYVRGAMIELTAWGFSTEDFGGARTTCAWRAASDFEVKRGTGGRLYVSYIDHNHDEAFFGPLRSLPGLYLLSAPQMASLMNAWRKRALGFR